MFIWVQSPFPLKRRALVESVGNSWSDHCSDHLDKVGAGSATWKPIGPQNVAFWLHEIWGFSGFHRNSPDPGSS